MESFNIIFDLLKGKSRLSRLVMLIGAMLVVLVGVISLIFNEIKKQDITKSQLEIEKHRISQIDKQLSSFYNKTYSDNDSVSSVKGQNKDYFLKQIEFLKSQREEAVKSIDTINKNPDIQILIFTLLTASLMVVLLMFFTSSFKSNLPLNAGEKTTNFTIDQRKRNTKNNEAFLSWATTNEIAKNNLSGLDLEKAKKLKEIYDLSEKLGDERNQFLNLIINFTNLKRRDEDVQNDKHSQIYSVFEVTQERLKEECNRLNKQALINLLLCFIMAFTLMSYIIYTSVINSDFKFDNLNQLILAKYTPRIIAISSFLTMFLYFVKLYKNNIVDVKYYQNELTNVEIKQVALKTALIHNNSDVIEKTIESLSNVERNAIFSKEQTTNELERIKLENEINKDYLNKAWELLTLSKFRDEKKGI